MDVPTPNPRRRHLPNAGPAPELHQSLPSLNDASRQIPDLKYPLRKGSTFHSPTSPRSVDHDPILNVPSLPRRSPTCSKQLEASMIAGDHRIAQLIGAVDRSLSGLESFSSDSQETVVPEALPVPRFMVDTARQDDDSMDIDPCSPRVDPRYRRKHHPSDSGIGSTETSERSVIVDNTYLKHAAEVSGPSVDVSGLGEGSVKTGINGNSAMASASGSGFQHALSEYACRQIQKHIILPIIREEKLKNFHPLVGGLPYRVARKEITCLRDLEKVLLWLAPKWSVSKASFLLFCETSIQCIHTTVEYLNENDQRRPTDRPYTQGYFLDLVEQVRQYAAMLSSNRARIGSGTTEADTTPGDESLNLVGGLAQTGKPAELVQTKNGKSISLRTGEEVLMDDFKPGSKRSVGEVSDDEDALRSMARRKKVAGLAVKEEHRCKECDKIFKRPCDLTKHEKTHSRPWKCSEANCKYYEYGWPTEKERDRHMNDKHSASPPMFKCRFHPCPYESKRESNCKQHMEKAHGWVYVRSKNNGKSGKRLSIAMAPPTPQESTPGSNIFSAPTPDFSDVPALPENEMGPENCPQTPDITGGFNDAFAQEGPSNLGEIFGPINNFSWSDADIDYAAMHPSESTAETNTAAWDPHLNGASAIQSNFDDQSLFGTNFDWSNMNHDLTSLNIQLATPATTIEDQSTQTFSRTASISLDQSPQSASHPSLSPGGHGDAMLYTPFSVTANDMSIDEGYDEFTQDLVARPARDFNLFDTNSVSAIGVNPEAAMFEDLSSLTSGVAWTGKGSDLNQQLEADNDTLKMEE